MSEITSAEGGKRRRCAQDWAQYARVYETSGQKVKEFCREQGDIAVTAICAPTTRIRLATRMRLGRNLDERYFCSSSQF